MIKFKDIELADKDIIDTYLFNNPYRASESCFSNLLFGETFYLLSLQVTEVAVLTLHLLGKVTLQELSTYWWRNVVVPLSSRCLV